MQKPTVTHLETELPALVAEEKPYGIKRKPVATSLPTYTSSSRTEAQKSDENIQKQYVETLPPRGYLPTQNRSTIWYIKTRWAASSRRRRVLVIVALLILLTSIVGLSAGLALRPHTQNLPLPSSHGGPYNGQLTYYDPGLGACGFTNSNSEFIVAVSHITFDAVSVGSNPNANPLCGKTIRARRGNKSVDLTVVDRCTGCQPTDIDVSRTVFASLADMDEGRVPVSWSWLEEVPNPAAR